MDLSCKRKTSWKALHLFYFQIIFWNQFIDQFLFVARKQFRNLNKEIILLAMGKRTSHVSFLSLILCLQISLDSTSQFLMMHGFLRRDRLPQNIEIKTHRNDSSVSISWCMKFWWLNRVVKFTVGRTNNCVFRFWRRFMVFQVILSINNSQFLGTWAV